MDKNREYMIHTLMFVLGVSAIRSSKLYLTLFLDIDVHAVELYVYHDSDKKNSVGSMEMLIRLYYLVMVLSCLSLPCILLIRSELGASLI